MERPLLLPSTGPKVIGVPSSEGQYENIEKLLTQQDFSILQILYDASQTSLNGCTRSQLCHVSKFSLETVDASLYQLGQFHALNQVGSRGKEVLYGIGPVGKEFLARHTDRQDAVHTSAMVPSYYPDLNGPEYCIIKTMLGSSTFYIEGKASAEKRGGFRSGIHRHVHIASQVVDRALDSLVEKGLLTKQSLANDDGFLLSPLAKDVIDHVESHPEHGLLRELLIHVADNYVKPSEIIPVEGIVGLMNLDQQSGALSLFQALQKLGLINVQSGKHEFASGFIVFMPKSTKEMVDAWTHHRSISLWKRLVLGVGIAASIFLLLWLLKIGNISSIADNIWANVVWVPVSTSFLVVSDKIVERLTKR